jgi:catechol 2,3-dioxygenase-like lactoylglutathione lyase family enzyme
MIDHVGYEVSDLARSGRFYDAIFFALGVRRLHENEHVIGWGVTEPMFWLTARSAAAPGYGHLAFRASGKAAVDAAHAAALKAGGTDAGPPGPRPQYGPRYYAAYVRDPDGLRVEVVASHGGRGVG